MVHRWQTIDVLSLAVEPEWTRAHEMQRYHWRPSYCRMPFNAEYFCALLGPRRLVFVGDSTLSQTASTLMNLILAGKGTCSGNVVFAILDTLVGESRDRKFDWAGHLLFHDPQIVVLGLGAHLHTLEAYKKTLQTFDELFREFEKRRVHEFIPRGLMSPQNISYVWKTINPGHLNCGSAREPLLSPSYFNASDPMDVYSWGPFDVFDSLGREFALSRGMTLVDMFPLYLRPDAHPLPNDCLHFAHQVHWILSVNC